MQYKVHNSDSRSEMSTIIITFAMWKDGEATGDNQQAGLELMEGRKEGEKGKEELSLLFAANYFYGFVMLPVSNFVGH